MTRPRIIGVIGAGRCGPETYDRAVALGRLLAEAGFTIVTGGLGGVMEGASKGAREAGGQVLGLLPGSDPSEANPWVTLALPTGLGDARNALIANMAEAFVALAGEFGTLSEIAFALKRGKRVLSLGSWTGIQGVIPARSPEEALQLLQGGD